MKKREVVTCFKVRSKYSLGEYEENHDHFSQ